MDENEQIQEQEQSKKGKGKKSRISDQEPEGRTVTGAAASELQQETDADSSPVVGDISAYKALVSAARVVLATAKRHTYGAAVAEIPVDSLDLLKKALDS